MAQLVRPQGITLDRDEALRYVGYSGQAISDELLERFEALVLACERDLHPVGIWETFPVHDAALADILKGEAIADHLAGAREAALMACTLGAESERELRKHMALSSVDGVLYGACASALVEAVANAVESQVVAAAAERGLRTNFRYSPGYGDLPLDVQPALLGALGATTRTGLACTADNFLLPTKSVTAIIGLFDADAPVPGGRSACATCQLRTTCELRRKGTPCHGHATS